MSSKPVQSIFFWRADGTTAFKAAYGRVPRNASGGPGSYTKDFHQPRNEQARALERAMGIHPGGDTAVEWRWPDGSYAAGRLKGAADFAEPGGRLNLRWETNNAPPPWRLVEHPSATTPSTLRGTPDLDLESDADAQLVALRAAGEKPWLIAVHLAGEGAVLHARVVLEHPGPGREFADWNNLPEAARSAMTRLQESRPGGFVEFNERLPTMNKLVKEILAAFSESPNVLLVGPPGTGKTVALQELETLYKPGSPTDIPTFDPDLLHGAFGTRSLVDAGLPKSRSLVFHPSYAYEYFVMGLLPTIDPDSFQVVVEPSVGPLLELGHFASKPNQRALLILDEFNRGAAAAIFGDTLALLDGDKRSDPNIPGSGAAISTPYFNLGPKIGGEALDSEISLPSSLKIVAAMNSADRSVAPLDAALRRRFAIIYVEPDYNALTERLEPGTPNLADDPAVWTASHVKLLAIRILEAINSRIESISGRDFLIGQSVFWHVHGEDRDSALRSLASAIDSKVMGTLALTYADADDQLAGVLKVGEDAASACAATWRDPDASIERLASRRLRPKRLQELDPDSLIATLQSLL